MAGGVRAFAGRAKDTHHGQLRIACLQRLPVQPELAQGGRPERRQQHIRTREFGVQHGLSFGGLQVGLQALHLGVHVVVGRLAIAVHGVGAGAAGGGQGFELGALRAHGGTAFQGGRAGQVQRQAQDADATQGL
ncbi:hypothetical protein D3C79_938120 [compost metagenome]